MIKTMIRVILTILLLAFALPLPAGDVKTSASAPAAATAGSKAHHQPLHHQVHHEVHHNTTPVTRPRPIVSDPCPPVTTIDRYNSDLYLFGPRIRPFAPTRHDMATPMIALSSCQSSQPSVRRAIRVARA